MQPIETRRYGERPAKSPSAELPVDYLKMVEEVFKASFAVPLAALSALKPNAHFKAKGQIYSNEILLSISLGFKGDIVATTFHCSANLGSANLETTGSGGKPLGADSKADAVEKALAGCVDALAELLCTVFQFNPGSPAVLPPASALAPFLAHSLAEFESIPFEWTRSEINSMTVWLKVDKSNLELDAMTEEWLSRNDPTWKEEQEQELKKSEELFFTGPKRPAPGEKLN